MDCSHFVARRLQSILPAASAPLTSHRSCQVCPGYCSSHRRTLVRPTLRRSWDPGVSRTNGGASNRASTASRDCSVAAHLDTGRRGGNCFNSAIAAGPSCRAERVSVRACVVTPCPPRTRRSSSPVDTSLSERYPLAREPAFPGSFCERGGRAPPRSHPRAGASYRAAWC